MYTNAERHCCNTNERAGLKALNALEREKRPMLKRALFAAFVSASLISGHAHAAQDEQKKVVEDYVKTSVKPWLTDPEIVSAVNAQNITDGKLSAIDIDKLDLGWLEQTDKKLIESRMQGELSSYLKKKQAALGGTIYDIFVYSKKGLNVGLTSMTSDYNQGDEAKYWKTFGVGPDAIFVDDVEADGDKPHVSQTSVTIKDPKTGKAIGAITFSVDLDKLK